MRSISFIKDNPLPTTYITLTFTFLFILFNLFNGWLSYKITTLVQSFASSFQAVVSQSTQNPDFAQVYSSSSLIDILFQNEAVKDSLFSLLGLYGLLIIYAGLFIFVATYLLQHFIESYQKRSDVRKKPLLQFTLFWVGSFVIYKIIFFFLNLRQVFVSVLTDNSSTVIFVFDKIFLVFFFYFASVSFVLLLKKEKQYYKKSISYGLKHIKRFGLYYAYLLGVIYILTFVPVNSLAVAFIVITIMNFFFLLYIIQIINIKPRQEPDVSFKRAGYSLGILFISGLCIVVFASTPLFSTPSLESDELVFDLPPDYVEKLRIENTNDIVLIEYVDFSCEYCKSAQPLLEQLRSFYSYDDVSITKRHYLLDESNPDTLRAAKFYECFAQEGGADAASSILFSTDDFSQTSLFAEASLFGINPEYYQTCMQSEQIHNTIYSDVRFAKDSGVLGTPAYVLINKQTNQTQAFHGVAQIEIMTSVIDSWLE